MESALLLIDYDNMWGRARKTRIALESHCVGLVDALTATLRKWTPKIAEADVRLYSGWTQGHGFPSRDADWMMGIVAGLRGRSNGIIVRPELAIRMIQFPWWQIAGTVRIQQGRFRQKMVDGMLGCDAIYVANRTVDWTMVVSDDDDVVPACLSAHAGSPHKTLLIRTRAPGSGLNDSYFESVGLPTIQMEPYQ